MSQQDTKRETGFSLTHLLLPAGAIAITIFGMFLISFSVVLWTGIFLGGTQPVELKPGSKKKSSGIVIISYSNAIEEEIKKSQLMTPELPFNFRYQKQLSLSNTQLSYRY
jgi:hypothetical protein